MTRNILMKIFAILITLLFCVALIFISDFVLKKYFGLGILLCTTNMFISSPRPNRQYKRFDGNTVSINSVGARGKQLWRVIVPIYYFWETQFYGSFINDNETFTYISCLGILNWSCHNVGVNGYGILNMIARSRYDTRINNSPIRIFTFISADFDRGLQNSNTAHFILASAFLPQRIMGSIKFYCCKIAPKMVWKAI